MLSATVLLSFIIYSIHQKTGQNDVTNNNALLPATTSTSSDGQTTPQTPKTSNSSSQYKDGQYVGDLTDAFYGNVQVKAIISNGRISDVQFLQYPSDRGTSIRINSQAMPYLTSEAIASQNSQVDIVTGATQTSLAFIQSLASALSKAK